MHCNKLHGDFCHDICGMFQKPVSKRVHEMVSKFQNIFTIKENILVTELMSVWKSENLAPDDDETSQ